MEVVKKEFPIAVLVLSVDRLGSERGSSGGGGTVRCEIQVDGESRRTLHLDAAAEVGLPSTFEAARRYYYSEPEMELPAGFLRELVDVLGDVIETKRPLWLQLDYPNGVLPLVPWERLLGAAAPWSVLRAPYHVTRPEASPEALDVALVATSPDPERRFEVEALVEQHVREIVSAAPEGSLVHVFADLATHRGLTGRRETAPTWPSAAVLHDPADAPKLRDSGDDPVDAPDAWFSWIARALGRQSVDVVHFVTHGYVGSNQGMLVLASAPENPPGHADADVIGARAIDALSRTVGAWCTMLTAPSTNYSVLGHRLLADAIARQRPGPVGLQDVRGEPVSGSLAETYRFLCGYTTAPPRGPDRILYVHPARTGTPDQLAKAAHPELVEWNALQEEWSAATGAAADLLRKGRGAPQWLASFQRGLEQAGSTLRRAPKRSGGGSGPASERGVEEALKFLSNTVRSHSRRGGDGGAQP